MFSNRFDAGEKLSERLKKYKEQPDTMVLAIPNGGVVCGHVIAKTLGLPLEIDYINMILHPEDPEKIIGYVNFENVLIENEHNVLKTFIEIEIQRLRNLQNKSRDIFLGKKNKLDQKGKTVILVDDGIETGTTIKRNIKLCKLSGAEKIVLAVPVAPLDVLNVVAKEVDEVICIEKIENATPLKNHYNRFQIIKDVTLIKLLA